MRLFRLSERGRTSPSLEAVGVGEVELSANMCGAHYNLRDIDDDVIDWLK